MKNPESLFLLEEIRDRKFDGYARKIQTTYRRWKAQQYFEELKHKVGSWRVVARFRLMTTRVLISSQGLGHINES